MLLLLVACMHHAPTATAPSPDASHPAGPPPAIAPAAASSATTPPAAGPPAAESADTCTATFDRGVTLYNAGATERAATTWDGGYAQCGPGHGFLAQQALAAAKLEHYDDAARLALRELSEPGPTPLALKLLIAMRLQVSTAVTGEVYAKGRTPQAPIVVPDIQGEYAWIRLLLCGGKEQALRQSLVQGLHGNLDEMQFVCTSGGGPQTLYFDYSADPTEQELIKELDGGGQ